MTDDLERRIQDALDRERAIGADPQLQDAVAGNEEAARMARELASVDAALRSMPAVEPSMGWNALSDRIEAALDAPRADHVDVTAKPNFPDEGSTKAEPEAKKAAPKYTGLYLLTVAAVALLSVTAVFGVLMSGENEVAMAPAPTFEEAEGEPPAAEIAAEQSQSRRLGRASPNSPQLPQEEWNDRNQLAGAEPPAEADEMLRAAGEPRFGGQGTPSTEEEPTEQTDEGRFDLPSRTLIDPVTEEVQARLSPVRGRVAACRVTDRLFVTLELDPRGRVTGVELPTSLSPGAGRCLRGVLRSLRFSVHEAEASTALRFLLDPATGRMVGRATRRAP